MQFDSDGPMTDATRRDKNMRRLAVGVELRALEDELARLVQAKVKSEDPQRTSIAAKMAQLVLEERALVAFVDEKAHRPAFVPKLTRELDQWLLNNGPRQRTEDLGQLDVQIHNATLRGTNETVLGGMKANRARVATWEAAYQRFERLRERVLAYGRRVEPEDVLTREAAAELRAIEEAAGIGRGVLATIARAIA